MVDANGCEANVPNGGGEAASACKKFDKTELLEGSAMDAIREQGTKGLRGIGGHRSGRAYGSSRPGRRG